MFEYSAIQQESKFFSDFVCTLLLTYNELKLMMILAVVLVCKASKKDPSVAEAKTSDDDLASYAQYRAIQMIKNQEIEGYGQHKVNF